jgi:hypothetical protein
MKVAEDIEIHRLCEQSGYGYVMQMACRMWSRKARELRLVRRLWPGDTEGLRSGAG